jgi:hypothetical protein
MTGTRKLVHGIFPPARIDPAWECLDISPASAGALLRNHTTPAEWGDPVRAVAWFARPMPFQLHLLVAEYAPGERATLRLRPDGNWDITFTTIPSGPAATWPEHYCRGLPPHAFQPTA